MTGDPRRSGEPPDSTGSTGFLYPFLDPRTVGSARDDQGAFDVARLMDDLVASARAKVEESGALRNAMLDRWAEQLSLAARAMAQRFSAGGRIYTFGNGGSATDADGSAALFRDPPSGRPLPAVSLVDDLAVLTALANDLSFELVFSRQLIACAKEQDMAIGFSTSGDSANVLRALEEGTRRGLLTIGMAGYEGGAMAASSVVDHCFVVGSQSVHRIQETQDALVMALWSGVQEHLGALVTGDRSS